MDMKVYVDHTGTTNARTLNQDLLSELKGGNNVGLTQYFVELKATLIVAIVRLLNRHQRMILFELITSLSINYKLGMLSSN